MMVVIAEVSTTGILAQSVKLNEGFEAVKCAQEIRVWRARLVEGQLILFGRGKTDFRMIVKEKK